MEKEIFSKTFKKVLTSSVAAVLLASSVSLTSAVFASADEQSTEQFATGCIPDSEETIKSHLASDE
ncbi:MAG: hypothetical protein ACI4RN_06270, partial [Oscillospiraceae bacterium]